VEIVIYPDTEKVLVAALQGLLDGRSESIAADVHVSTIKPPSDLTPYPSKTVVIRSDGGADLDHVRRLDRISVNIWAPNYSDANELARLVASLIRDVTGDAIKNVRLVLHPVRVDEEGPDEHRYLTAEVVVKATTLAP
jgi:hypothetical protein